MPIPDKCSTLPLSQLLNQLFIVRTSVLSWLVHFTRAWGLPEPRASPFSSKLASRETPILCIPEPFPIAVGHVLFFYVEF